MFGHALPDASGKYPTESYDFKVPLELLETTEGYHFQVPLGQIEHDHCDTHDHNTECGFFSGDNESTNVKCDSKGNPTYGTSQDGTEGY